MDVHEVQDCVRGSFPEWGSLLFDVERVRPFTDLTGRRDRTDVTDTNTLEGMENLLSLIR